MKNWMNCSNCGVLIRNAYKHPFCNTCKKTRPNVDEITAFWNQVDKSKECWEWIGALDTGGYGMACVNRHNYSAHRLSYELTLGPIPDGILVCHKCDNRKCVNPMHLFLGTYQDNSDDMVKKGRSAAPRGEAARHAKLTAEQVKEIRAEYATGYVSLRMLAIQYGVQHTTIEDIVHRRTWRHV